MLTRKVFLAQLTSSGLLLSLGGCGGSGGDDDADDDVTPAADRCSAFNFSANHGHTLQVPAADLDSTTAKTYSVRGTGPHNHSVTLSAVQLALLKAGQPIGVTTTSDGLAPHTHDVTGTCR